jgi:hypothetical protein
MIKPKYKKGLDSIQLARAGVEQAIGGPLKPLTPKSPQSMKTKGKRLPRGA